MAEKVKPVYLVNPASIPWWRDRLTWLIDNHPRLVEHLFRTKKLAEKLGDDINAALTLEKQLVADGKPEYEAHELAFEVEISPPMNPQEQKPIPALLLKRIMRWADAEEDKDTVMK